MAINDIVQTIAGARVDARSLSDFVFKPAGFKVARRLAPPVDTLQFYIDRFNSLNGDFSSFVSVALSSLNDSVAEAQGKVEYIEATVQDAINNTAVEGGILADTFVTATAKSAGMIARSQREINAERTSIGDFGNPAGDDWTSVIHKAAKYGKPVHFPARRYEIRKDKYICAGNNILFYGDEGAELVIIDGSDADHVFDGSNSPLIVVNGFKLSASTASTSNNLFWFNPTSYVKELNFDNNKPSGAVKYAFGTGLYEQDPFIKFFGFDYISVKFNDIKNSQGGLIQFGNFPIRLMETNNNTVRNLSGALFSAGVGNGAANDDQLMRINNYVCLNNTLTTDTDYWSETTGTYHTLLLVEGKKVTYKGNSVDGFKTKQLKTICDAYLSCRTVISHDNDVRNIGNFNPDIDGVTRNIFHFKNDASVDGVDIPHKEIHNNTFIVDKNWLADIGETNAVYRLANFGIVNGGDVSIKNCIVKVPTLCSNTRNNIQSLILYGNTIEADNIFLRTSESSYRFWDIGVVANTDVSLNKLIVTQNNTVIRDMSNKLSAFIQYQGSVGVEFLDVSRNNGTFKNTAGMNWLSGVIADVALVNDNTTCAAIYRDFQLCKFNRLSADRNKFIYDGALTTLRPLDNQSIAGSGVQSATYSMKPIYFRLATLSSVQTGVQNHRIKIEFQTATGLDSILYNFTTDNTTATKKVKFLSPEGASVELTLATATSTIVPVKAVLTTEGTVPPTYTVGMILTAGEIRAQVLGVSAVKNFKLSIDTSSVS